jgi:hypothetical protein
MGDVPVTDQGFQFENLGLPPYLLWFLPMKITVQAKISIQVTFNGMPLYTFTLDKAPGDANGNGVNQYGGVWHVVSLESTPMHHPPSGGMGGGYHY